MQFIANAGPDMGDWFWDNGKYVGIAAPADLQALQSLNIPTISISVPMHQRLVAAAAPAPAATLTIDAAAAAALGEAIAAGIKLPTTLQWTGSESVTVTGTGKLN